MTSQEELENECKRNRQKYFEELEAKSEVIACIKTNIKYYCAYAHGWCMPKYVNEKENYVIFYYNPGWIGNWYWKTPIDNFKKYFKTERVKDGGVHVPNVEYVDVSLGFDNPRIATNKKFP